MQGSNFAKDCIKLACVFGVLRAASPNPGQKQTDSEAESVAKKLKSNETARALEFKTPRYVRTIEWEPINVENAGKWGDPTSVSRPDAKGAGSRAASPHSAEVGEARGHAGHRLVGL